MKRKTIYEIANSTTELGVTLPINAIVQNIDTKEVFSLNEKALSTNTLDDLSKTSFGGESTQYPIIYANSDVLIDGDGSYEKPYKTLSNLVSSVEPVYDTENAALVSGSNILTIDTTSIDLKKGDKIISSYLPYNTYVVDFNATTITVSNAATSTGTYSIFFMREYLVKAFGTFNIDASIEKDGLFWDFSGATLILGNATAFNITSVKNSDFFVKGGRWLKTHQNSKIISNNTNQQGALYYSGDIPIDETSNRFTNYYIQTNDSLHSNLFIFENNTNIGNIATTYDFAPTTKINRATVTGNVVITLPTYSSNQSVSVMLKLTQGGAGGYDITFQDAINLSQFVFTDGTVGQRTWVTLLWDGEEWCFTASVWNDAV